MATREDINDLAERYNFSLMSGVGRDETVLRYGLYRVYAPTSDGTHDEFGWKRGRPVLTLMSSYEDIRSAQIDCGNEALAEPGDKISFVVFDHDLGLDMAYSSATKTMLSAARRKGA